MKTKFRNLSFFFLVVVVIWLKTYIVYKMNFNLSIENFWEEIILFINPISSVMFFLGLGLLLPAKLRKYALILGSFFLSFLLFANVLYYREFTDFITIPLLMQTSNAGELGSSIFTLFKWTDLFMFLDVLVLAILLFMKKDKIENIQKSNLLFVFVFAICIFVGNLVLAEIQRPQLLTRAFDREILVKFIGTYNYQLYDVVIQSKTSARKTFAEKDDLDGVLAFINENKVPVNADLSGIAKGKNLILISMESTQSFVVNKRIDGKEVTPFLNSMIRSNELFYFDNLYHQVSQGKTSDAEFIMDNSLYPLSRGAVFFTHPDNEYLPMTEILKDNGYYTAVLHANNASFWNRNLVYKNFGTDRFYSLPDYKVTEENSIGWGLKDVDFFKQSVNHLSEMKQPFYAKMITLTNHFPFTLNDEDKKMPAWTSNSQTVNNYFPTVRYTDEALKVLFDELKKAGLYDNSVIVIYGDHYGISQNHNKAMGMVMGRKITPFESAQLQRTPLFIHVPGVKGKVEHKVSGQIDVRPTILNLLGAKYNNQLEFGNDLFSKQRASFALFRDGSFITKDYVFSNETCYSKAFGTVVSDQLCTPYKEKTEKALKYSDQIIYGDLIRFFSKDSEKTAGEVTPDVDKK
mgnify:CR=1 FL=1